MKKFALAASAAVVLAGCAAGGMFGPAPKDGELAKPSDYSTWPVFLAGIEKPTGHIRDIYINKTGASAQKGEAFPNGTVSVMEIYKANKGADGKLAKANLEKVFVMYKGKDWGTTAPEGMKTGDWVYSAFEANGEPAKVDYATCRGCHMPLADKDFVFHYDKYFDTRKAAALLDGHAGKVAMSVEEAHLAALVTK
ncbi:cytochrome P460 family protein [Limnobacter humi]|uniref:Cytochrome P460 family protein n=1 Tax=Limnobacter humi TaxID=1778671 RepID=A0ABT1WEY5_9BURK|nr:cytochrome P460 family protein [Limnobacter humi]MCQ8895596.1 cytochrome P460 family protein [Limnobacter humi]